MRLPVCLAMFLVSLTGQELNKADKPKEDVRQRFPITLLYTGRLLGYARISDSQTYGAAAQIGPPSIVAKDYMEQFKKAATAPAGPILRLGMGDNFAPSLFARSVSMPPQTALDAATRPKPIRQPKDRFFSSVKKAVTSATPGTLGDDNVAEFFAQLNYNALVPGLQDFYYGADKLQVLAANLEAGTGGKTRILGANLYISTTHAPGPVNVFPRIPERYAKHSYQAFDQVLGDMAPDLPATILPWNRKFKITGAAGKNLSVAVCREDGPQTAGDPDRFHTPPNKDYCTLLKELPQQELPQPSLEKNDEPTKNAEFGFEQPTDGLVAGLNYGICAKAASTGWACQAFSVQTPLFGWEKPGSRIPWQTVTQDNKTVVVFGVVAPDLLAQVGMLNGSWKNRNTLFDTVDTRFDTVVSVTAPELALRQALDSCLEDKVCREAPKVLMAQMSPSRARQLLSSFYKDFDAVLSTADSFHYSGAQTEVHSSASPRFVLTPPDPTTLGNKGQPHGFTARGRTHRHLL